MRFCECKSNSCKWRDAALINGEFIKVDEPVFLCENEVGRDDATFDIEPIIDKLAEQHSVDKDDVLLASFEKDMFPEDVLEKIWGDKMLGGYCTICGGEI